LGIWRIFDLLLPEFQVGTTRGLCDTARQVLTGCRQQRKLQPFNGIRKLKKPGEIFYAQRHLHQVG
jgi:hypothetical protein